MAWLRSQRVDMVKLSTLGLVLEGQVINPVIAAGRTKDFEHIVSGGDEGPWLFLVPSSLTASLASVPDATLPEFADAWLRTDELQKDRWERAQVLEFLRDLKTLAAKSQEGGSRLLLRMSM
jgi:hypothetical protein